jgi:SAM-dependent methyltransferase
MGSVLPRELGKRSLRASLYKFMTGENPVETEKCRELLARVKAAGRRPKVLVIGGGTVSSGARGLYADPDVDLIGTDVYASPYTSVVADGHHLPFRDDSFDGVWIQAVLEHVLEPQMVADEIHRVLKPGGLVYADTPFMQQVHEGAYDFTRFTLSGHRWLFRKFDVIDAGVAGGAGIATLWSIRAFARSLGAGYGLATLIALPFVWLRFLEKFAKRGLNSDAASATFFFGSKSSRTLTPLEMVAYFNERR